MVQNLLKNSRQFFGCCPVLIILLQGLHTILYTNNDNPFIVTIYKKKYYKKVYNKRFEVLEGFVQKGSQPTLGNDTTYVIIRRI